MPGSALSGLPPNNHDDWLIIRGRARLYHIPDSSYNPNDGFPIPVHRPQDVHYRSRGPDMIAGAAVAIFMVLLLTSTRLYLRFSRKDLKVGPDDFAIIPAACSTIVFFSLLIAQVALGGCGKHAYDQTYQQIYWNLRLGNVSTLLFWPSVCFIKISIVLFNRRLTGLTSQRWMYAHYSFLAITISFLIAAIFSFLFQCHGPVDRQFSLKAVGSGPQVERKCLDANKLGYGLAIIHTALDFALLTVPLIVLYQMKRMSRGKKIRLGFLFAIGAISCIGSVMRQVIQDRTMKSMDQNYEYPRIISWTIVDIFFGITAANLPVLNVLIPKRWRSPIDSDVPHMSSWKGNSGHSVRLGSSNPPLRPDGTIMGESVDLPRDNFHEKTVKRWDDAFVRVQKHESMHDTDVEGNASSLAEDSISTSEGNYSRLDGNASISDSNSP